MNRESTSPSSPILVAIDFSPYSARALIWGARMARSLEAPLVVLHVVHDPNAAPGYYQHPKKHQKYLQRVEEAADEMMTDFLDDMRKKRPKLLANMERLLVVGLPVTRILEVAEQTKARLIVMGSHGRTGLKHLLLGSKAEKVVRLAPVPVTIVKHPKD